MKDVFTVPEVMARLAVITEFEEGKFTDIPKWEGQVETWTTSAVKLYIPHNPPRARDNVYWLPFSQMRKAEDGQSVYASTWILDQKGL